MAAKRRETPGCCAPVSFLCYWLVTPRDRAGFAVAFAVHQAPPMSMTWIYASIGGVMIGAASAMLLLTHGRIAGISGITGSLLQRSTSDRGWRLAFLGGLAAASVIGAFVAPSAVGASVRTMPVLVVAGLLVGFGTRLGNGCTSGHGVCGIARMSMRSLLAVATFTATGAITAMLVGGAS